MAEIKRTKAGQSYLNRPIGVVNVRSGAERTAQAEAEMFGAIADAGYRAAVNMQRSEAANYLKNINVTDSDGNLVTVKPEKNFGRYGNMDVQQELSRRYANAWENEIKDFAKQLKEDSGGNAESFKKDFEAYLERRYEKIKESGGADDLANLQDIANMYGGGAINSIRYENLRNEEKRAVENTDKVVTSRNKSVYELAVNGSPDAENVYKTVVERIEGETGYTEEQKRNRLAIAERNYQKGLMSNVIREMEPDEANRFALSVRTGVIPDSVKQQFPQLKKLSLDAVSAEDLGSSLQTVANAMDEAGKEAQKINEALTAVQGFAATQAQIDLAAPQLEQDDLDQIIRRNNKLPSQDQAMYQAIAEGRLPFSPEMSGMIVRFEALRTTNTPYGTRTFDLGLDQKTVASLSFLANAAELGPESFQRAYQQIGEIEDSDKYMEKIAVKFLGDDKVGAKATRQSVNRKFFEKKLKPLGYDQDDFRDYGELISTALFLSETPGDAIGLIQREIKKDKHPSRYMTQPNSRYALEKYAKIDQQYYPEIFKRKSYGGIESFESQKGDSPAEKVINNLLSSYGHKELNIRENVILQAIPAKSDQTQASYYIIHKDGAKKGQPVQYRGSPMIFNTSMFDNIIKDAERIRLRTESKEQKKAREKAEYRAEMAKRDEPGLQIGKIAGGGLLMR